MQANNNISFTRKAPKKAQIQKAYKKAIEDVCGQTNIDYFNLSKKANPQQQLNKENLIEKAKKFFSTTFNK